jgi:glutamate synthase (NADPH/NADH) small chain
MDAARMALRLGAEEVTIVYRRTRAEMPARLEEISHAHEEGVKFEFLRNPVRIYDQYHLQPRKPDQRDPARVAGIELQHYQLGASDPSGRRSPVPVQGATSHFECDAVIIALGNNPNPLLGSVTPGLIVDNKGRITVDENQKTSIDRVYAGGDIVRGAFTVILAMGEGRIAARAMNQMLAGDK